MTNLIKIANIRKLEHKKWNQQAEFPNHFQK